MSAPAGDSDARTAPPAAAAAPAATAPSGEGGPAEPRGPCVLQVLPALESGGVERGTLEIASALTASGMRALIASRGGRMLAEVPRTGASHVDLPVDSKNPWTIRKNGLRLAALIRERGVDLVHVRSRAPAWSAHAAARMTGRPFVTTFHNAYDHRGLKRWYNGAMARGHRVIAISDFVADHVRQVYGVGDDRLVRIHRGVDVDIFDPARVSPERMIQMTRDWNLPDDHAVVLLPGRLTEWKGHRVLIDAMARLEREDVICLLVGGDRDSRYAAELEEQARRTGLGARLRLVGDTRDMSAAYMLSDVVVSASTRPEGFGRVIAEGHAMGRPVIATAHGAAPEILRHGDTGWLVPPNDPAALAAGLERALTLSDDQRQGVAERARRLVLENFTTRQMQDATLAVYSELLERRAAAS